MRKKRGKKSQVWVETVIYTLIGLAIMGGLIAAVTPRINKMLDKATLEQTIASLDNIDDQIRGTLASAGNQWPIEVTLKKGEYVIDGQNNSIYYVLRNTNYLASQLNDPVRLSTQEGIVMLTRENAKKNYDVYLTLSYASLGINLTYAGADTPKTLTPASVSYKLLIINQDGPNKQVDIRPI